MSMSEPRVMFTQQFKSSHDRIQALFETGDHSMMPVELERYLYQLNLSPLAERVYRYHLSRGWANGKFMTQERIKEVAEYVNAHEVSVSRAYQQLEAVGLLTRIATRYKTTPAYQGPSVTILTLPQSEFVISAPLPAPSRSVDTTSGTPATNAEVTPVTTLTTPGQESNCKLDINAGEDCARKTALARAREILKGHQPPIDSTAESFTGETVAKPQSSTPAKAPITSAHERNESETTIQVDTVAMGAKAKTNASPVESRASSSDKYALPPTPAAKTAQPSDDLIATVNGNGAAFQVDIAALGISGLSGTEGLPITSATTIQPKTRRLLTPGQRHYLRKRIYGLTQYSDRVKENLYFEVLFSAEVGAQANRAPLFAINSAMKLIERGKWRTPFGFDETYRELALAA